MTSRKAVAPHEFRVMVEKIRASSDPFALRDEVIVGLLYGCGVTLTELALLRVGDVYETGVLKVVAEVQRSGVGETISTTMYIPENLRETLLVYWHWRMAIFQKTQELPNELFSEEKLFVDNDGKPFQRFRSNTSASKEYHSYNDLTALVKAIHVTGGIPGGNAEIARRSWTQWLYTGIDGKPPVHLEWLMALRGDSRMSNTLIACGIHAKGKKDVSVKQLSIFMIQRNGLVEDPARVTALATNL